MKYFKLKYVFDFMKERVLNAYVHGVITVPSRETELMLTSSTPIFTDNALKFVERLLQSFSSTF